MHHDCISKLRRSMDLYVILHDNVRIEHRDVTNRIPFHFIKWIYKSEHVAKIDKIKILSAIYFTRQTIVFNSFNEHTTHIDIICKMGLNKLALREVRHITSDWWRDELLGQLAVRLVDKKQYAYLINVIQLIGDSNKKNEEYCNAVEVLIQRGHNEKAVTLFRKMTDTFWKKIADGYVPKRRSNRKSVLAFKKNKYGSLINQQR